MKINLTFKKMRYLLSFLSMILIVGLTSCGSDDTIVLSSENELITFSLADVDRTFTIDLTAGTVAHDVALPFGFDASNLVATFTISESASVTIGDVEQVSGVTANDFSNPVTYTVAAENTTITADFVVTVDISETAWNQIATNPFIALTRPSAFVHDDKLWLVGAVELDVITDRGMEDVGSYFEYVYSSVDGVAWDIIHSNTPGANDSIPLGTLAGTIAYDGNLVNVGGLSGAILGGFGIDRSQLGVSVSSDGGSTWTTTDVTEEGVPSVVNPQLLENNGDLFIVGAQSLSFGSAGSIRSMDIYKSTNGTSWEAIGTDVLDGIETTPFPPTFYATATFNGEMYIAGGVSGAAFLTTTIDNYSKSVYKSADGITWSVASADGFPQLIGTQIVDYKGKLYAIGGVTPLTDESGLDYKRDVYVSEDGATWTLLEGGLALPTEFDVRTFHNVVVMNDKIYIIGGENAEGSVNDVWVGEFVN